MLVKIFVLTFFHSILLAYNAGLKIQRFKAMPGKHDLCVLQRIDDNKSNQKSVHVKNDSDVILNSIRTRLICSLGVKLPRNRDIEILYRKRERLIWEAGYFCGDFWS